MPAAIAERTPDPEPGYIGGGIFELELFANMISIQEVTDRQPLSEAELHALGAIANR